MRLESDKDERWFLGFEYEGQDVFMKECVYVEEERSSFFIIKMNMQITNKGKTILEKFVMCH